MKQASQRRRRTPTVSFLLALAGTLVLIGVFSVFSLRQIDSLRELQTQTVDKNRRGSLQLLRIQNDLNSLGMAMRDMVERQDEQYPFDAWRGEFERIRNDLDDALRIVRSLSAHSIDQQEYLAQGMRQFWLSVDQVFETARSGDESRARRIVSNSLQAQQASLTSHVARLLVRNYEAEERASGEIQNIYSRAALNLKMFTVAMVSVIAAAMLAAIQLNRRMFQRLSDLSEQRSTLAQRLINVQEQVFRSVARDLHDDFGQILTAVGTMLRRAEKKHLPPDSPMIEEVREVQTIVQETLDKTRSFSQALHPAILDDYGLERAIERYVETFERQTGVRVNYARHGDGSVPDEAGIHVYRVLQEALTNVTRHAQASEVSVKLDYEPSLFRLEVQDNGVGSAAMKGKGLGMIAMEERAELLNGSLSVVPDTRGTLVRLEIPLGTA